MLTFTANRIATDGQSILARWFDAAGAPLCFCLEPGAERLPNPAIPTGTYALALVRDTEKSAEYARYYASKFGIGWHKGMVAITDVPGRSAIEFHVGNTIADTLGCSLAGTGYLAPPGNGSEHYEVTGSRAAYEKVYPILRDAILAGTAQISIRNAEAET